MTTPTLYAHRGARVAGRLAAVLTWDRAGDRHVETVFDYRKVGLTREASNGWERKPYVVDWSTFGEGGR
jgi:hypothetical protein